MFCEKFEDWPAVLTWGIVDNEFKSKLSQIPWHKSPLARHEKYVEVFKLLDLGWNQKHTFVVHDTLEECLQATEQASKEFTLNHKYNSLQGNPKLNTTLDALQEVQEHFEQRRVGLDIVELYRKTMQCEPWQVLCFLLAIHLGKACEFSEIPSRLLCQARGLPYRSSDSFDLRTASRPSKMIGKPISFLLCTEDQVYLYVKDEIVMSIKGKGVPVVIPTTSSKKQRVILLHEKTCKVLSVTSSSITEVGEFEVDADGPIDFMDAFTIKRADGSDHTVLQWGAGDCIRGVVTWAYCAGLDENLNFFEVPPVDNTFRTKSLSSRQDFSLHGNLLSLRLDTEEAEVDGKRQWTLNQSILCDKTLIKGSLFSEHIDDVWGSPQQHLILNESMVYTIECGFIRNEAEVVSGGKFVCGLPALSRLSGKSNKELQN